MSTRIKIKKKFYNHLKIEKKWQKFWEKKNFYQGEDFSAKKKKYILDMFPYPSGAGLHVGHVEGYTASDIYSRYLRMQGYNVLHPMGWDAFGLPTENYALKLNQHPQEITRENTDNFRRQCRMMGFSYDWTREINTSQPAYYQWTQWIFLQLYKRGLAYRKQAAVNWCNSCQTVLAREQVIEGRCERCKKQVVQKELKQWFFKITDYAERLLQDLDKIDWPEPIKKMQENWIGRSEGINIEYEIQGTDKKIVVFTTRPDTNFGATFITLAPDSEFVKKNISLFPCKSKVLAYIKASRKKTELERIQEGRKKSGVFTGLYALNQLTGEKMPVYLGDFVLASVGTGAVVGVPGHDKRDFEFAQEMGLPIKRVVVGIDGDRSPITKIEQVQEEKGVMINSAFLDGLDIHQATKKIMDYLEDKGWGKRIVHYKLRDWLISRQRYWGAPIPIIYCEECGETAVPEKDLPVELPDDIDFRPHGESPLKSSKKFHKVKCPHCRKKALRESDTMDTFVCSSWYYLRFLDPQNRDQFCSPRKMDYWMPVDLYLGGAEHAVMHLLYARFIYKVLADAGFISLKNREIDEPFQKLRNQGLILAEDGRKMSKSLGNVVNPDEVVKKFGADTMRLFEMFIGPLEEAKSWNTRAIAGMKRFLEKVYLLYQEDYPLHPKGTTNHQLDFLYQKTIKKVTQDIENLKFNTAISQMMIFVNQYRKAVKDKPEAYSPKYLNNFLKILAPFAPHLAEEIYHQIIFHHQKESIFEEPWPNLAQGERCAVLEKENLVIQINGKKRDLVEIDKSLAEEDVKEIILKRPRIKKWLKNKKIKKMIFIKGKVINLVI